MKRAVSLAGGGAMCAYEAGALTYLMGHCGYDYPIISGVSGGALNAGRIAQFPIGQGALAARTIADDWHKVRRKDIYKSWFPFGQLQALCRSSLFNSKPLRKYVERRVDLEKVRTSGRKVMVGVVNLNTGAYQLFDESDEHFIDGILASASYTLAFLPIYIKGEPFSDGGLRNVSPISAAIKAGADVVDVIMTHPPTEEMIPFVGGSVISLTIRALEIMSDEIIQNDIAQALLINELVQSGKKPGKRVVEINVLRPDSALCQDSLEFDHGDIQNMLKRGYNDAKSGRMVSLWPK